MRLNHMLTPLICSTLLTATVGHAGEVTIKRDETGMPHVYAENSYDLYYGYGYAVGQDRLYSIDMARRSSTGHVAEVLGAEFIDYDKKIRSEYWPASIQEQIAAATADHRDVLEGYAAGVNAWIDQVNKEPGTLMPKEYLANDFQPEPWSAFDVAMVFVGSMLNRYGDFNSEVENAALLDSLTDKFGEKTAAQMFDTLVSRGTDGAPTTIPADNWDGTRREQFNNPLRPIRAASISEDVLRQVAPVPADYLDQLGKALPQTQWRQAMIDAISTGGPAAMRMEAASNMAILGPEKLEGAKAVLVNGPQFGWFTPAYTYAIGLHGAGFDVVGNTALAYPGIMFAHNGKIAWGSTWAAGDQVDIYRETVNPDNPSQYRRSGEWVDMESRDETIDVKGGNPVTFTAYRTFHGPVIARDEEAHLAFAKKRAWSGAEIANLVSWVDLMKAQSFDEFREAVRDSAVNVNNYYADSDGNIGYVFNGFYPKRVEGHDGRLPASGEGEMDWEGIMPFETNPQVLNPSNQMVVNWNNKPAAGFPSPDEWWYSWMPADRVSVIFDEMGKQGRFTPEKAWATMVDTVAQRDVNAPAFLPFFEKAVTGLPADDPDRLLVNRLTAWDQSRCDADGDGLYDAPEVAIMETLLETFLASVFTDLPEPYSGFFAAAGYPDPDKPGGSGNNIQVGAKVAHYNLLGEGHDFIGEDHDAVLLAALKKMRETLTATYGENVEDWRSPVGHIRYSHQNFRGIPQTLPVAETETAIEMNRGTENNMVVFSDGGVRAMHVLPPGQSGFIAPDGTKSPHYNDQAGMYEAHEAVSVWFTADEVDANTVEKMTLNVSR